MDTWTFVSGVVVGGLALWVNSWLLQQRQHRLFRDEIVQLCTERDEYICENTRLRERLHTDSHLTQHQHLASIYDENEQLRLRLAELHAVVLPLREENRRLSHDLDTATQAVARHLRDANALRSDRTASQREGQRLRDELNTTRTTVEHLQRHHGTAGELA